MKVDCVLLPWYNVYGKRKEQMKVLKDHVQNLKTGFVDLMLFVV